ncbi:MAG: FkbM family methyltransferase [Candidatus Nanopusillus sp.]
MNKIEKLLVGPRAIFKSRKLIKNLSSSLYQYLILRKQNIKLKLRDGDTITVSRFLYPRIIYYYYLGYIIDINKYEIKIKLNDKIYSIPINALYSNDIGGIITIIKLNWQYKNNYWEKNGIKFKYAYGSLYEVFDEEDYKFLNVKDKNVLDIGAFVGDSPIYFILKGAKKVYAIEPHPDAYNEMIENIKLNNMEDKIIPINMGINYCNNYITINTKEVVRVAVSFFNSNNKGIKIPAGKLSEIIDKNNIDAQILKMDCEGCEYDIILKDYDTIKEFDEIGFEYHTYNTKIPVSKLLDKLNKDFECKIIKEKLKNIGLVYCIRKK